MGHRVGVVDTDIQSPGIHVLFGFSDDLGNTLNDYLWGKISVVEAAHEVTDVIASDTEVAEGGALFLVPSSMKAADIARVLREGYDVGTLNDGFRDLTSGELFSITSPEHEWSAQIREIAAAVTR